MSEHTPIGDSAQEAVAEPEPRLLEGDLLQAYAWTAGYGLASLASPGVWLVCFSSPAWMRLRAHEFRFLAAPQDNLVVPPDVPDSVIEEAIGLGGIMYREGWQVEDNPFAAAISQRAGGGQP